MRNSGVMVSVALALALSAQTAAAQQGRIEGRVHDASDVAAIVEAEVQVVGQGDPVLTDAEGRFSVEVAPGTHAVVVSRAGYGTVRRDGVQVAANGTVELTIELSTRAHILNPVVVTASRRQEKALEAPASISIVSSDAVDRKAALTVADHVVALPGVDRAQTGLTSGTVVTRGFNNVFSGALLTIIDNRYARVPSLRFNAYSMFPTNDLDIDRVEVSLGPGSALYGPNAASGVMHLITPSPLDRQGSSASVAGGERSLMQAQFRTAQLLSDGVGFKVSAQYQSGTDWPADSMELVEESKREGPLRDPATERYSVDARMDVRVGDDGAFVLSGGRSFVLSGVEMTGIGAYQLNDWAFNYLQARLSTGRFFAQVFRNMSNSGARTEEEGTGTFNLRTKLPVYDRSYTWAAQFQYGIDLGSRQSFTYGVDWQRDVPRSEGTIYGDAGTGADSVRIEEVGAYLHSETALGEMVDLVAAVRVDDHNRLEDLIVSPRAALVFTPSENQSFRVTYNRAFSTPATNNLFLDIHQGNLDWPVDFFSVRALGVPPSGFTFAPDCPGGYLSLCMYTPLERLKGKRIPAHAPDLWEDAMDLLAEINPAAANIVPLLRNPGALGDDPELGTVLRRLNTRTRAFDLIEGPDTVHPLRATGHRTFEVGYKGLLGDRLLLAADVYDANVNNMVGPIRIETPNVFLEPESVGAYVVHRLRSLIQAGLITEAQALELAGLIAQAPLGTIALDQREDSEIIATYRNYHDVDYWGIDLAAQFLVSDRLSLRAAYSTVSNDCFNEREEPVEPEFRCSDPLEIALNAPKRKGNLGFVYDDPTEGFTFEGRIRFTDSFPMNSGTYIGIVGAYQVVDASLSYDLPFQPGTRLTLTANNIGNYEHQEFVGAPQVGRLLIMRVRHEF
ncbi:MAG: TonB-dependent receptor [Gemmatimonadetes bacterium]|nr:TonB-dependent receptor [Gemmatimonadota bacterium]MCY3942344.1 TonB-dependent receptor [Gemmatimonadota bacterium]